MTKVQITPQMTSEQIATAALENLLKAAQATVDLWHKHGMGDDEDESFPVYRDLVRAILEAEITLSN